MRVGDRPEPVLVTTAPPSPGAERRDRERRYLLMMAVRVIAFIVAIVFATGWIRFLAVAVSLIVPWIAVVLANAAPTNSDERAPSLFVRRRPRQLEQRRDQPEPTD